MIVKQHDKHQVVWTANMDLTGTTVRLLAKRGGTLTPLDAVIIDAPAGKVGHTLTGTLDPGTYQVELEVTQGASIVTFPNDSYSTLTVTPDLG